MKARLLGGGAVALLGLIALAGCGRLKGILPVAPPPQVAAGQTALKARKVDEATRYFDQALKARPGDLYVFSEIVLSCGRAQEHPLLDHCVMLGLPAFSSADKEVRANALDRVALAYLQLGDREQGLSYAQQAYALAPEDPLAMNNLGYLLAEDNRDLDKAIELTMRATQQVRDRGLPDEEVGVFADSLGWAYYKAGRLRDALLTLLAANDLNAGVSEMYYHLAVVQQKLGQDQDARVSIQRALELPSESPQTRQSVEALAHTLGVHIPDS